MPSQPNSQFNDEPERDDERHDRDDEGQAPEDQPGEPGAEGGSATAREKPPGMPEKDDPTPVGDTDQHSTG
jgi:hypothetical protein